MVAHHGAAELARNSVLELAPDLLHCSQFINRTVVAVCTFKVEKHIRS